MSNLSNVQVSDFYASQDSWAFHQELIETSLGKIGNNNPANGDGIFEISGDIPVDFTMERKGESGNVFTLLAILYSVIRRYCRDNREQWADCFQEGIQGLYWAIVNHNPSKGKLQTIAYRAVQLRVRNFLRSQRKALPLYVIGDGKRTIGNILATMAIAGKSAKTRSRNWLRYNPETIEMKLLRSQGIETMETIVPKGSYVFVRYDFTEDDSQIDNDIATNDNNDSHAIDFDAFKETLDMNERRLLEALNARDDASYCAAGEDIGMSREGGRKIFLRIQDKMKDYRKNS